jgi:hypothetical protein
MKPSHLNLAGKTSIPMKNVHSIYYIAITLSQMAQAREQILNMTKTKLTTNFSTRPTKTGVLDLDP